MDHPTGTAAARLLGLTIGGSPYRRPGADSPDMLKIFPGSNDRSRPPVNRIRGHFTERRSGSDRRASGTARINPAAGADSQQIIERTVETVLQRLGAGHTAHRTNDPVRTIPLESARFTLREFYESKGGPRHNREVAIAAGYGSEGTLQKETDAVRFWEKHSENPPVGEIDQAAVRAFIAKALSSVSRGYVKGLANQIRGVLNRARDAGLIAVVPSFQLPKQRTEVESEFRGVPIFEAAGDILATLQAMGDYLAKQKHGDQLLLALQCGASFGPRTIDLLTLKRSQFDLNAERPAVRFRATKTSTAHVIPLADWLVAAVQNHNSGDSLFPDLISLKSRDPARSRAARETKQAFRDAAFAAGFDWHGIDTVRKQKPFQVLRATCNERFERHSRRAGEFILGHGMAGVNRASYQNPGAEIYEAVQTLPQPAGWLA